MSDEKYKIIVTPSIEDGGIKVTTTSKNKEVVVFCKEYERILNKNQKRFNKIVYDALEEELWKPAIQKPHWFKDECICEDGYITDYYTAPNGKVIKIKQICLLCKGKKNEDKNS